MCGIYFVVASSGGVSARLEGAPIPGAATASVASGWSTSSVVLAAVLSAIIATLLAVVIVLTVRQVRLGYGNWYIYSYSDFSDLHVHFNIYFIDQQNNLYTFLLIFVTIFFRYESERQNKPQAKNWNSHPWGDFGSGFHSVRSKMGPYKASIEAASSAATDDDGLDNLGLDIDDTTSTSTGTVSTLS